MLDVENKGLLQISDDYCVISGNKYDNLYLKSDTTLIYINEELKKR